MDPKESPHLLPVLSEDLELLCLMHVPWQSQGSLLLVCKRWCQLVVSGSLARARQAANKTEELLAVGYSLHKFIPGASKALFFQAFNPSCIDAGLPPRALPSQDSIRHMRGPVLMTRHDSSETDGGVRVAKYDSISNAWMSYFVKDHSLSAGAGLLSDGRIVLVGGGKGGNNSRKVTAVSASMTSQEPWPELNGRRCWCTVLKVKGDLWVLGGSAFASGRGSVVGHEVLSKDGRVWNSLPGSVWMIANDHYATDGTKIMLIRYIKVLHPRVRLREFDCMTAVPTLRERCVRLAANGALYLAQCWPVCFNKRLHLVAFWHEWSKDFCKMITLELLVEQENNALELRGGCDADHAV